MSQSEDIKRTRGKLAGAMLTSLFLISLGLRFLELLNEFLPVRKLVLALYQRE